MGVRRILGLLTPPLCKKQFKLIVLHIVHKNNSHNRKIHARVHAAYDRWSTNQLYQVHMIPSMHMNPQSMITDTVLHKVETLINEKLHTPSIPPLKTHTNQGKSNVASTLVIEIAEKTYGTSTYKQSYTRFHLHSLQTTHMDLYSDSVMSSTLYKLVQP